jgi:hypothetical protein
LAEVSYHHLPTAGTPDERVWVHEPTERKPSYPAKAGIQYAAASRFYH